MDRRQLLTNRRWISVEMRVTPTVRMIAKAMTREYGNGPYLAFDLGGSGALVAALRRYAMLPDTDWVGLGRGAPFCNAKVMQESCMTVSSCQ